MKILYISSNHSKNNTLMVEHEITELQRDAIYGIGRRMEFVFLPALPFEDVENQILVHKPDIVHISAHGEEDSLELVDSKGIPRKLTVTALRVLLAPSPPRLVYLNACDSAALAEAITDVVPFAIGTEAPISNFAARKGAVAFYRALSQGRSLASAFASSESTVKLLDEIDTSLFSGAGDYSPSPVFYEPTRMVAQFRKHDCNADENGTVSFELGIAGCPASVIQTVFVTSDKTFISGSKSLESDLCSVKLDTPWNGEVWLDHSWSSWGDIQIFALLIMANGEHFSVSSTLCNALTSFYEVYHSTDSSGFPDSLKKSLAALTANDGSRMRPSVDVTRDRKAEKHTGGSSS